MERDDSFWCLLPTPPPFLFPLSYLLPLFPHPIHASRCLFIYLPLLSLIPHPPSPPLLSPPHSEDLLIQSSVPFQGWRKWPCVCMCVCVRKVGVIFIHGPAEGGDGDSPSATNHHTHTHHSYTPCTPSSPPSLWCVFEPIANQVASGLVLISPSHQPH